MQEFDDFEQAEDVDAHPRDINKETKEEEWKILLVDTLNLGLGKRWKG